MSLFRVQLKPLIRLSGMFDQGAPKETSIRETTLIGFARLSAIFALSER